MSELPDVPALRAFEPPPNGLAVLRAKLGERRRPWWLLVVPALAAAIAVLVMRTGADVPTAPISALPDPTVGEHFYWVASTPGHILPTSPISRPAPVRTTAITDMPGVTYRSP